MPYMSVQTWEIKCGENINLSLDTDIIDVFGKMMHKTKTIMG